MIPGLLAEDVSRALREFIIAGYETETPPFAGEFSRLVEEQQDGEAFLKGPYINIGLPFRKGRESRGYFDGFETLFPPYLHQEQAWNRLGSTRLGENTIVATGTGSGKTECFLYPVLDHCRRELVKGNKGIKVIIVYPMNALATDQAKRFARTISSQDGLKGLRVGLYVGGSDRSRDKVMTEDRVIACKETMQSDPPDILLTNYKMLDYLLMRPKDQALWQHNAPETLRYLVVDELHTFDGAQGTDLALLIRRLKARLQSPNDGLICVGTSATLGSQDQKQGLMRYAQEVFDAPFGADSIIVEQRLAPEEFIDVLEYLNLNPRMTPSTLLEAREQNLEAFLSAAYELFFLETPEKPIMTLDGRIHLGRQLRSHGQVQNILRLQQTKTLTPAELAVPLLRALRGSAPRDATVVIQALLALLAHARDEVGQPLVQLRVQLWARELRRIVACLANSPSEVGDDHNESVANQTVREPLLWYADDTPNEDRPRIRLPLVQCRECHGTAWLSRIATGPVIGQKIIADLQDIYGAFFKRHSETAVLIPKSAWPETGSFRGIDIRCCAQCGMMSSPASTGDCTNCQASDKDHVHLVRPDMARQVSERRVNRVVHDNTCPYCRANGGLVVFGARASSLSAVAIHRLFSSRDNDDKKLISFSDSVQDAAHRAGFFSARTWHNNIRMAISQLIERSEVDIPLSEIANKFEEFWLEDAGGQLPVLRYIKEFTPPESRYRGDFERFEQTGTIGNPEPVRQLIKQRVLWQVCEDLGWRSQVGRSLNRVGVGALDWRIQSASNDSQEQRTAWKAICSSWKEPLFNDYGVALTEVACEQLLLGILQYLIQQGAVFTEFVDSYVESGGNAYQLSRLSYTPAIGPSTPRPKFPAVARDAGFEAIANAPNARNRQDSWYTRWLKIILSDDQLIDGGQAERVVEASLDWLVSHGLLATRLSHRGTKVWGINPEVLIVTGKVVELPIQNGRALHVASKFGGNWEGVPDLSATSIEKRYEEARPVGFSFFRKLYLEGEIHRVISHEHTGLLERSERERIENSFIKGDKPWEYNLLSATPTLEMGIDIGDLSSVLLCSVPPAQANYLQRVGRGGRRDGNSFVLTVANGRPHDLVFYADPRRMLDTPVEPPAVFLKARHVLRRQLLAYAFDCWTMASKGENLIPRTMQPVLDAVEKSKPGVFPYTLLKYVSDNAQMLWDGFCQYVAKSLSAEETNTLSLILFGGGTDQIDPLHIYVNSRLKIVSDERKSLGANIDAINRKLKELEKQPDDEHKRQIVADLEEESIGFKRLRARLNNKETLNFFTDEGLLPNYAFPEEGTTLHSIIFRREEGAAMAGDAANEWVKREYEYQRPAQAALVELAPNSVFYAGNRKVKVSRVETAKGRNIQQWRFCPRCNYSTSIEKPDGGYHAPSCPRCNSAMWSDASATTKMLKMSQVYAFTNARDAQLDDRSDDREPEFFNRQLLIDFTPDNVLTTWVLKDEARPFGFEFIRSVNFLEVNFGRREAEGENVEVAGVLLNRSGFQICESCGKVQNTRGPVEHLSTCPYHDQSQSGNSDNGQGNANNGIIRCLYLYRQFASEAMRILLPRLAFGGTEEQIQSFVAALQLGLKRQFGGKVDHLRVAHQTEPVGDSDTRRHFLVLYDSIPGGTGYLQEMLADADIMRSVFSQAWEAMNECDCYDGAMDGCYRCLLEYRNSFGMEQTKKSVAMMMLSEIINPDNEWIMAERSLSGLKQTPWVDSELEARFPQALEQFSGEACVGFQKVRVRKDVINQKNGYRIIIGDRELSMEPHVKLGRAEGVVFQSEADFVISDSDDETPSVAIFLDGYEYHKDIVQDDLLKRQALIHAGYVVWSLNWYDINQVLGDKATEVPLLNRMLANPHNDNALLSLSKAIDVEPIPAWATRSPLERLMRFLSLMDGRNSKIRMDCQAWYWLLHTIPLDLWANQADNLDKVKYEIESAPVAFQDRVASSPVAAGFVTHSEAVGGDTSLGFICSATALTKGNTDDTAVILRYSVNNKNSEVARINWQNFWHCVNVLQFMPNFYAYTPGAAADGVTAGLNWSNVRSLSEKSSQSVPSTVNLAHKKVDAEGSVATVERSWLDDLDDELRNEFNALAPEELDAMDGDVELFYELTDTVGEVVAEAELAWPKKKLAFLCEYQRDYMDEFISRDWRIFDKFDELVKFFK